MMISRQKSIITAENAEIAEFFVTLSETKGLRFFAEFILSGKPRFFTAFKMTVSEGLEKKFLMIFSATSAVKNRS